LVALELAAVVVTVRLSSSSFVDQQMLRRTIPRLRPRTRYFVRTFLLRADASFPRRRESRQKADKNWMPACAGMTY
jgi:hypothetical protein